MSSIVKKYPTKNKTIIHVLCLLTIPLIVHYLFPAAFFVSFFIIPFCLAHSWLSEVELCISEHKKEYIAVRTFVKLIPLVLAIVAIKILA